MEELIKTMDRKVSRKTLNRLINETVHIPISPGYIARCYCSRCGASWEMRSGGIKRLQEAKPLKLPKGINDLKEVEEIKKCFFIIEPCFTCRKNGEQITAEVKLIPQFKK